MSLQKLAAKIHAYRQDMEKSGMSTVSNPSAHMHDRGSVPEQSHEVSCPQKALLLKDDFSSAQGPAACQICAFARAFCMSQLATSFNNFCCSCCTGLIIFNKQLRKIYNQVSS